MATKMPQYEIESISESSTDTETERNRLNHYRNRLWGYDPEARHLSRRKHRAGHRMMLPVVLNPPSTSSTIQTTALASQPAANSMVVCRSRDCSCSEHCHHGHHHCCSRHASPSRGADQPHNPPNNVEAELVRGEERDKLEHDKKLREEAIQKYQLDLIAKEKEKQRILNEALIEEDNRKKEKQRILNEARIEEENKKAALEAKKKEWEAEAAAKKVADAEVKKKKDAEIEQALRERMAKAGYHNVDIETVVKGKGEHYCHEHGRPHPCGICISKTTFKESVSKSRFGHKVRKDLICTETLRYFGLLYEHDPDDEDMLVILSDPSRWDEAELLRYTREHYAYDRSRSSWTVIRSISGRRHNHHETRFVIERPRRRRSSFFGL